MKIITVAQRTPEWHAWREGKDLNDGPRITATSAVTISGKSPWSTPHKLWLELTGRAPPRPANVAMQRGVRLEPKAREAYIKHTGVDIYDACIESSKYPWVASSLDGISTFGDLIVEIKVPGRADHDLALSGQVPEKYIPQVQWQLLSSDGTVPKAHYWSYYEDEQTGEVSTALVEVFPDPVMQKDLFDKAELFRRAVFMDVPPAGSEFEQVAHQWLLAYRDTEEAKARLEAIKERLLGLMPADQQSVSAGGVLAFRSNRTGAIGYKDMLEHLVKNNLLKQEQVDELSKQFRGKDVSVVSVKASPEAQSVLAELDAARNDADATRDLLVTVPVVSPVAAVRTGEAIAVDW